MSGGSFDYLAQEEIHYPLDCLRRMVVDMNKAGVRGEIVVELRKVIELVVEIKEILIKHHQHIHDWEWYRSGDTGMRDVKYMMEERVRNE